MTDPVDQQVVDWLAGELAKINQASGFRTTLPADRIFTDENAIPSTVGDDFEQFVVIADDEETSEQSVTKGRAADLAVDIRAVVPSVNANGDSLNPRQQLRSLFADIRKVLAPFGTGIDGAKSAPQGVAAIQLAGRTIDAAEAGEKNRIGEFRITVRIRERHDA